MSCMCKLASQTYWPDQLLCVCVCLSVKCDTFQYDIHTPHSSDSEEWMKTLPPSQLAFLLLNFSTSFHNAENLKSASFVLKEMLYIVCEKVSNVFCDELCVPLWAKISLSLNSQYSIDITLHSSLCTLPLVKVCLVPTRKH